MWKKKKDAQNSWKAGRSDLIKKFQNVDFLKRYCIKNVWTQGVEYTHIWVLAQLTNASQFLLHFGKQLRLEQYCLQKQHVLRDLISSGKWETDGGMMLRHEEQEANETSQGPQGMQGGWTDGRSAERPWFIFVHFLTFDFRIVWNLPNNLVWRSTGRKRQIQPQSECTWECLGSTGQGMGSRRRQGRWCGTQHSQGICALCSL